MVLSCEVTLKVLGDFRPLLEEQTSSCRSFLVLLFVKPLHRKPGAVISRGPLMLLRVTSEKRASEHHSAETPARGASPLDESASRSTSSGCASVCLPPACPPAGGGCCPPPVGNQDFPLPSSGRDAALAARGCSLLLPAEVG